MLIEEFPAVRHGAGHGQRLLDGVVILNGEHRIARWNEPAAGIEGQEILVIQAKDARLGMYRLGQALFSRELLQAFKPSSIRTVALCTMDDAVLRPLAEAHGIEVVVRPRS